MKIWYSFSLFSYCFCSLIFVYSFLNDPRNEIVSIMSFAVGPMAPCRPLAIDREVGGIAFCGGTLLK